MSNRLLTLSADPDHVARLVAHHAAAATLPNGRPNRHRPGWGALLAVHRMLADRYRDERGYVDETVEQLATANGYSSGVIRRCVQLLDHPDWWPVVRRGGSPGRGYRGTGSGSRREPAWSRAVIVDNSENSARDDTEAARAMTEAARAMTSNTARGARGTPTPNKTPREKPPSPWAGVDNDGFAYRARPADDTETESARAPSPQPPPEPTPAPAPPPPANPADEDDADLYAILFPSLAGAR